MFDIPSVIESSTDLVDSVITRIWPDPTVLEESRIAQLKHELNLIKVQTDINLEESKHSSLFVSGWRPACGWIAVFGLGYVSILEPLIRLISLVFFGYEGDFPIIDSGLTLQILLGMLGLGTMRTYEKSKGVSRSK